MAAQRLVRQLVVGEALDLVAGGPELAVAAGVAIAALLAEMPAAAVGLGDRLVVAEVEVDAVAAEQRDLHLGFGEQRFADELEQELLEFAVGLGAGDGALVEGTERLGAAAAAAAAQGPLDGLRGDELAGLRLGESALKVAGL